MPSAPLAVKAYSRAPAGTSVAMAPSTGTASAFSPSCDSENDGLRATLRGPASGAGSGGREAVPRTGNWPVSQGARRAKDPEPPGQPLA
jgi:hypothetical protein